MNNVSLIGRLTKDVQERRTQSGTPVVSFTLAVDRRKKEDGADFINCIAWDKAAETIARYVHKGDLFGVTGYIQTRNYEKDGRMNYVTEVVTTSFQFLERKREMSSESPSVQNNSNYDYGWGNTRNDIGSSDLPF
jgi:single-strand DNA-binding protein